MDETPQSARAAPAVPAGDAAGHHDGAPSATAASATVTAADDTWKHTRLQRYYQWCDHYRTKPVTEVAIAFRYTNVTSVAVAADFGALDVLPLAEMLKFDNVITVLDLQRAKVGDSGCYALADALPHAATLLELNLNYNDVGDRGAAALARGLERNHSLQRVYLRGNVVGTAGAVALARLLRRTRTLSYVDVSNNYLRVRGVHELTRALVERAQARLTKRAAALAKASGLAAPTAHNGAPGGRLDERLPRSGNGLGWLWGGPQDLVVTNDYVVRTDWGSLGTAMGNRAGLAAAFPSGRSANGSGSSAPVPPRGTGPITGGGSGTAGSSAASATTGEADGNPHLTRSGLAADVRRRGASRAASSALQLRGLTELPQGDGVAADAEEDMIDIEVRISGNFVHEEIWYSLIHGLGLALSAIGAFPLLSAARSTGDGAWVAGIVCYVIGLVSFFASSTLNHSLFLTDARHVFRLIDHSAVGALIAGTYSPFLLVNLRHTPLGTYLLCAVWLFALLGVWLSTSCTASTAQKNARVVLYVLMGWIGVLPWALLRPCLADQGWTLLAVGGVVYSCGILLYLRERGANPHTLQGWWYLMVLAASALHYAAVSHYVAPPSEQCIAVAVAQGLAPSTLAPSTVAGIVASTATAAGARVAASLASSVAAVCDAAVAGGTCAVTPTAGGDVSGLHAEMLSAAAEALSVATVALAQSAVSAAADSKRALVVSTASFLRQVIDALEPAA